ncbi:putative Enoyl-CoA hydratase [Georgfuchsia toluolica]|uniref:Enoyl-CoA hydratase n=1 Tax=Georgfuchsia toluolica TaxID=424218 RepID=A0A916J728_9PROT|nr:enoyl-CoA hydratase/isomerase family protein [Georgfuchsia toluolica]CAG4885116.1 putative Enoyl-CoA hydratase [Georgfuchsia toluolica]CAG4885154.1 putative Enoyl-CoA hydratase [Georgfuchsia toluolica]
MPKKREAELLAGQWNDEAMLTDEVELGKQVLYATDKEKHTATITFNAPEALNGLPVAGLELVGDLIKRAEADNDVKIIVFKGNGPCFGTGANASELGHYIGYKDGKSVDGRQRPTQRQRMLPDRNIVFGAFERVATECLKATVCQVHGYCYGAHMQLALASDIVIASPDAQFGHPAFRYLGCGPQNMYLWLENLGIKKMKEVMLTMRALTAAEAEQAGFVAKVVPREELEQWVADYCQAIALMPLDGIMMGKANIQMMMEARGKGIGTMVGWVGHGWCTNMSLEKGEFNFLKERRNKGLSKALHDRDQAVAPYFRMGGSLKKAAG